MIGARGTAAAPGIRKSVQCGDQAKGASPYARGVESPKKALVALPGIEPGFSD
jgi:hypothetical protein